MILKAGTIPLRWAFFKEIIEKDVTVGIIWFSGEITERQILSPEIAQAIFYLEWPDERAKLANMLAAVTGLRAGEIQGLRVQDLGKECLYIRHSWNNRDRLKTTKNNEIRTVEVPFPSLIEALLNLAKQNPHGVNMDSYVFWARQSSSKPVENILFLTGLRDALIKAGMSEKTAAVYVFHGWRHFFTAYMRDKLNDKLLKSQTGHKTDIMLDRYAEHWIVGDREKVRQAQREVFGALVPMS
jgi:integrase